MTATEPPLAALEPSPPLPDAPRRPNVHFLRAHPAHMIALGFGSGLSPIAPGTVGTLWAWAAFLLLQHWLSPVAPGLAGDRGLAGGLVGLHGGGAQLAHR